MSLLTSLFKPLAYLSLPVFLLHTASNASPLARYYVRLGLFLSTMGVCSVWGVFASIGMTLIGRRFDINWIVARSFYALASRLLGIYIEVEGEEHLAVKPAVMIGNHQSMLDILFVGRIFPTQSSMTSKKELKWMPLLGQFMTLSGAVFIDRKSNARAVQSVTEAGKAMKDRKTSLWVFPEGTRTLSEKPSLLPFKKGAFHLAVQSGVPITPVVCEHYYRLYRKGVFESGKLKIKGTNYVLFLPPVPTVGLTASDVGELAVKVREQMLEALYEISGGRPEVPQTIGEEKSSIITPIPAQQAPEPSRPDTPPTEVHEAADEDTSASAPLAVDTSPSLLPRRNGSDRGTETEEDEGMVLVDRPDTPSDSPGSS
ncbi:1-acylglycerol-3-phosphate O [Phellopilus nigrolimitatus]|nr:1-acylglycerol-3-phosphate O [Phellopilus nigrolimitatus]